LRAALCGALGVTLWLTTRQPAWLNACVQACPSLPLAPVMTMVRAMDNALKW
jgi:hypothetical protein